MTVAELIEELKKQPQHAHVCIRAGNGFRLGGPHPSSAWPTVYAVTWEGSYVLVDPDIP